MQDNADDIKNFLKAAERATPGFWHLTPSRHQVTDTFGLMTSSGTWIAKLHPLNGTAEDKAECEANGAFIQEAKRLADPLRELIRDARDFARDASRGFAGHRACRFLDCYSWLDDEKGCEPIDSMDTGRRSGERDAALESAIPAEPNAPELLRQRNRAQLQRNELLSQLRQTEQALRTLIQDIALSSQQDLEMPALEASIGRDALRAARRQLDKIDARKTIFED